MDWYSKTVFTVIALALALIAGKQFVEPARAQGQECGSIVEPCYVIITERSGSPVPIPRQPIIRP